MGVREVSRRQFLIQTSAGLSTAWLAANWPAILAASEHAHRVAQASAPAKFAFFSAEQAAQVESIAAQIIPSDDTPGAREAHVVYFIDRALVTFDRPRQQIYKTGGNFSSNSESCSPARRNFPRPATSSKSAF